MLNGDLQSGLGNIGRKERVVGTWIKVVARKREILILSHCLTNLPASFCLFFSPSSLVSWTTYPPDCFSCFASPFFSVSMAGLSLSSLTLECSRAHSLVLLSSGSTLTHLVIRWLFKTSHAHDSQTLPFTQTLVFSTWLSTRQMKVNISKLNSHLSL